MRNVLITGGSSGIGFAVARRFIEAGDRVFITGKDPERLEGALQRLIRMGGHASAEAGSLEQPETVRRIAHLALREMGTVDVLVNNAGIAIDSPLLETTDELWEQQLAINLTAPFLMSRAIAQAMMDRNQSGVIINTSSIDAAASEAGLMAYCASKAGLESLTRSMALELAPRSIRVNCVSPGWVDTPAYQKAGADPSEISDYFDSVLQRVPMGRIASPDEIAGVYVFLASPEASYITGASIVVDGGRLAG